jgi:small subunit ribosomal protein S17
MQANKKTRVGRVISDKMEKTVVVQIEWREQHPLYRRVIRRRRSFKAHNEANQARLGDLVRIVETRPISKDKRWSVLSILQKGDVADLQPGEIDETLALPGGGA